MCAPGYEYWSLFLKAGYDRLGAEDAQHQDNKRGCDGGMRDLLAELNAMCDRQPFSTNWFLKSLVTGETAERGGDEIVASASTRKTSIMMAALKEVHEGRFNLDDPVVMQAKYQNNSSGTFQHLTPGFTITFRDALVMMIIVSDNTCTGTVADMIGIDKLNEYCKSIGMTSTTHRYGLPPIPLEDSLEAMTVTTANDQGLLLEMILDGVRCEQSAAKLGSTPELCKLGLDILSWQKLRTRLPSFLPQGTIVAHKTGTGPHNYNDAGIVFAGEKPLFILTAYTGHVPVEMEDGTPGFAQAAMHIGKMARACYDALKI